MANVEAVILAAGLSSRLGSHKLLLPFQDKTIIETVVDLIFAGGLEKINIVVGFGKEEVLGKLQRYSLRVIENPRYRLGMSTSLKAAVEHVSKDRQNEAIFVFNGDMPLIRPDTVRRILEEYNADKPAIMAPYYRGRRGHPVVFAREMYDQLLDITGDLGAREVLHRNARLLRSVIVDDPGIHFDIDTAEEYAQALAWVEKSGGDRKQATGKGE